MKKQAGLSLAKKLSVIIAAMILVSTTAVGLFGYLLYRGDSIKLDGERAMAIAQAVAAGIDPADFEQAVASGVKTPEWERAKAMADDAADRNDTEYLYVITREPGADVVTYYVEGYNPAMGDEPLDLGHQETAEGVYADEVFETLNTGTATYSKLFDSEGFGKMVTGSAPIFNASGKTIGVVGVDIGMNDIMAEINSFGLKIILIVLAFAIVFGLLSIALVNRLIGRPVKALTEVAKRIAVGDLETAIDVHTTDEIGQLADSFREMVDSTSHQVEVLEQIADGDLTVDIAPRSQQDMMSYAMLKTVDNLNCMFAGIRTNAGQLSLASGQIADSAQHLAQGSTDQGSTIDRLATSMERVADKARANGEMAQRANELVNGIAENAQKGSAQMGEMLDAVRQIDEATQAISKVIRAIDDIASQTNILALNAAVEAARAGQHGKGFAVVADEVRNLAAKSAASAKETGGLIDNTVEKAALGVRIATETSTTFEEIVGGISESGSLISGIAEASNEQSIAVEDINAAVAQVALVAQQNSAMAEESAASSEELSGQSAHLTQMLARFNLKDGPPRLGQ